MKWYPVSTNSGEIKTCAEADFKRALISYAMSGIASTLKASSGFDLLVDSGAFSVWSRGKTIDLDAYIAWCLEARESHDGPIRFVNLDVIPGSRDDKNPSRKERERAIRESAENADTMREAGLLVTEVYHRFEPIEVFDLILDRRQPGEVVSFGGIVASGSPEDKRLYCDAIFSRIRERCGGWENIPPVHGLGIAPTSPLGRRYPWWSCDASSWLFPRKAGLRPGKFRTKYLDDTRTSVRPVAQRYLGEALATWRRLEVSYTRLWEERGITYAADIYEEAVHA